MKIGSFWVEKRSLLVAYNCKISCKGTRKIKMDFFYSSIVVVFVRLARALLSLSARGSPCSKSSRFPKTGFFPTCIFFNFFFTSHSLLYIYIYVVGRYFFYLYFRGGKNTERMRMSVSRGSGLGRVYCLYTHTEENGVVCWLTRKPPEVYDPRSRAESERETIDF